jgi:hypothetical protein
VAVGRVATRSSLTLCARWSACAKRAFRRFRSTCFWSYWPDLVIGVDDVPWVAEQLMKHGNREAWQVGAKLCR